jgi:hypothetical protein
MARASVTGGRRSSGSGGGGVTGGSGGASVAKKATAKKASGPLFKKTAPVIKTVEPRGVIKINSGSTTVKKSVAPKKINSNVKVVKSQGSYTYVAPDGTVYPNKSLNIPGKGTPPNVKINSAPKATTKATKKANAKALKAANKNK